tara:strand:- start:14 stop:838 length:825 start_codon:yes stop_codon:yes gene_type:complete
LGTSFNQKSEEGFSLIELIIVIAVLSILAIIGGPYFLKLLNMARFAAAKMVLSESYTSCVNNSNQSPNAPNIPGVTFQSTNCSSLMSATIDETCTISLDMSNGIKTGWEESFDSCSSSNRIAAKNWNFDVRDQNIISENLKEAFEEGIILSESSYATRDNPDHTLRSAYIIVKGKTKEEAQKNAERLGGNLVDIKNTAEETWLQTQYARLVNIPDSITSFWTKQSSSNGDNSLLLQDQYIGDDGYVRNPDPNAELLQFGIVEINMESSRPGWTP